ncbi:hypothetical protein IFR04_003884 [Cadophora malorum]|uniref:Cell cycle control protein n=1 Tax=Cadophora malorum TaxID=108018 RepID=A0A8H7WDS1_9HELO|nr:hypothetical protein IFR04_003884 [Cadophora malorum]
MSHSATLSPSPIGFMGPTSFFSAPRFPSSSANDNHERRRTSHPHNSHLQPRVSEEMSDRFHSSQQRPRLEHRASQTIIDLTDEPEESPAPPRNVQPRNRPSRPPQLGRSDAVNLGDLIDLTDDSVEQDVIFTGERQLPAQVARHRPRVLARPAVAAAARADSPSLFLPARNPPAPIPRRFDGLVPHGLAFGDLLGGFDEPRGGLGPGLGFGRFGRDFMDQLDMAQMVRNGQAQAMPHALDYQHAAFAEQKPEHIPPPAPRPGFTRSTKEAHVLVCPSCEEELIQNNEIEEPIVKKSGKAPTKKEREEHPFWVVKDCGHVYCNACFQVRTSSGKTGFKESTKIGKKAKTFTCAVEDCDSDIKAKEKWVGVFL